MSTFDYGNFNRDNDYSRYQLGQQKKTAADAQVGKSQQKIDINFKEAKQADAKSLDALGAYGFALSGLAKKPDVSGLGLSQNDQALVGKYVNQEQQARISEDMLGYFA